MATDNSPEISTPSQAAWELWHARRLASVTSPTVTGSKQERHDLERNIIAQGVRLWDSNSEGIQSFETIETYPFEYVRETPGHRNLAVPGEIEVSIEAIEYTLDAFDDDRESRFARARKCHFSQQLRNPLTLQYPHQDIPAKEKING